MFQQTQVIIIVIISLVLVGCNSNKQKSRGKFFKNNKPKTTVIQNNNSYKSLYRRDDFINDDELLYKSGNLPFDFQNVDREEKIQDIIYNHSGGKIAALLPLTGDFARVAQSIKNAITLAVFDDPSFKQNNIQVQFYDTKANIASAKSAIEQAIRDDVDVVVGPLTANSTEVIYDLVESYGVPTISLSNDNRINSDNIIVFGLQPIDQVKGLLSGDYADNALGVLLTDDLYGESIYEYLERGNYDIRAIEFYKRGNNDSLSRAIRLLKASYNKGDYFSTVLMPISRNDARIALPLFLYNDMNLNDFIVLGNDKWDQSLLKKYQVVIAQAKGENSDEFITEYEQTFDVKPNFIANIAYDAIQLAKHRIIYGSFSNDYLERKMGSYANYYLDGNIAHRQMGKLKYNRSGRTYALAGDSFDSQSSELVTNEEEEVNDYRSLY